MDVRPQKKTTPFSQIARDVIEQTVMIFYVSAEKPCEPKSKTMCIMINTSTLQNLNEQIMCTIYNLKRIIKKTKFILQNFGGLDLIFLKGSYQRTLNLYEKLGPVQKCFVD